MMNEKIGFECTQVLLKCDTVEELDEAIRIVNNTYPVLREHLEVFDEIKKNGFDGRRICFLVGRSGKKV